MAKLVNGSLVLALFVVCASVIIEVHGARDIDNNVNSPAEAPYVDPLPETCRITGPCGDFLAQLIVTKAMPGEHDVVCCTEFVQTSKYCWETIMKILEDPIIPAFANLHPWAENAWNKCVSLTESPAQAPKLSANSPTQAAALPAQCRISKMCQQNFAKLMTANEFPNIKQDYHCCSEIVQTTKYCWDKTMKILEDPNVPALAHIHSWAEKFWKDCVDITNVKIVLH